MSYRVFSYLVFIRCIYLDSASLYDVEGVTMKAKAQMIIEYGFPKKITVKDMEITISCVATTYNNKKKIIPIEIIEYKTL